LLITALAITLWLAGRIFLGDEYLPIRWANFAAPWILAATIALSLFALLKRQYLPLALLICAVFQVLITASTTILPKDNPTRLAKHASSNISVVSFNVGHFNHQYDEISRLIGKNQADIIFLQEVSKPRELVVKLSANDLTTSYNVHTNQTTGLVLLSRFKIETANRLPGVLTRYKVTHPSGRISLWNIHVPRSIWSTSEQYKVITNLLNDMKRHPGPKIIAGDFNLTPYNDAFHQISISAENYRTTAIPTFTYPTPTRLAGVIGPWVQIDHIIVTNHFQIGERKRLGSYAGSDHYPISAQLEFRGNAYTGLGKGDGNGAGEG